MQKHVHFFNRDKALFGIDLDSANVHGSENPTSIRFQETPRHNNNVLNSIIVNDTFAPMRRGWICRLQKIQRPSNLHTTYLSRYSR